MAAVDRGVLTTIERVPDNIIMGNVFPFLENGSFLTCHKVSKLWRSLVERTFFYGICNFTETEKRGFFFKTVEEFQNFLKIIKHGLKECRIKMDTSLLVHIEQRRRIEELVKRFFAYSERGCPIEVFNFDCDFNADIGRVHGIHWRDIDSTRFDLRRVSMRGEFFNFRDVVLKHIILSERFLEDLKMQRADRSRLKILDLKESCIDGFVERSFIEFAKSCTELEIFIAKRTHLFRGVLEGLPTRSLRILSLNGICQCTDETIEILSRNEELEIFELPEGGQYSINSLKMLSERCFNLARIRLHTIYFKRAMTAEEYSEIEKTFLQLAGMEHLKSLDIYVFTNHNILAGEKIRKSVKLLRDRDPKIFVDVYIQE